MLRGCFPVRAWMALLVGLTGGLGQDGGARCASPFSSPGIVFLVRIGVQALVQA